MEENTLVKVEHIWHKPSDRWIYIETHQDGWLGLNFMQGNEYHIFKESYCEVDTALSVFFDTTNKSSLAGLRGQYDSDIEFIDVIIWVYFEARVAIDRYPSIKYD